LAFFRFSGFLRLGQAFSLRVLPGLSLLTAGLLGLGCWAWAAGLASSFAWPVLGFAWLYLGGTFCKKSPQTPSKTPPVLCFFLHPSKFSHPINFGLYIVASAFLSPLETEIT
jgi:hypothetical protein